MVVHKIAAQPGTVVEAAVAGGTVAAGTRLALVEVRCTAAEAARLGAVAGQAGREPQWGGWSSSSGEAVVLRVE